MKNRLLIAISFLPLTCILMLVSPLARGQSAGSTILTGIERITDTGIDTSSVILTNSTTLYRRYRHEVNLVGTINGIASNSAGNYDTAMVDRSNLVYTTYSVLTGDIRGIFVALVGLTSDATLGTISGKLIIKESAYETQRLANASVILVFPRSIPTYLVNGEPYVILTPTPNPPGSAKWSNLSTRVRAGIGDDSLIVGFVVAGNIPKNFLVRVIGPSLAPFGVSGVMPDPRFQVFAQGSPAPLAQNDDWGGGQTLVAAFAQVGAFGLSGPASKDAALILTLAPGAYSVVVNATATNSGVALVEVYEL